MYADIQPTNCFVGMFDIIGFKALREKKGTAGLHRQFVRGIIPAIQHSAAGKGKTETIAGQQVYVPDFSDSRVRYLAVSDSVLFFTPDDAFESFVSIISSAFMLLQFGFNGSRAPYRGAIGWGDLIADPQGVLIGSAIEDAYKGESSQAWAGAMVTQECRAFAENNNYIQRYVETHHKAAEHVADPRQVRMALENAKRLAMYPVPIQHNPKDASATYSTLETYAIDWTIRMYEGAAAKSFDPSEIQHSVAIADNTRSFEQWARSNNR